MTYKVPYSKFCIIFTLSFIVMMACVAFMTRGDLWMCITVSALLAIPLVASFFFAPVKIVVTASSVTLCSPLWRRSIPMSRIASAVPFQPTMGTLRICASGGFMGYWGIFAERDLGRFFGFFGKASGCVLLRLTDGSKYVIGSKDPASLCAFITSSLAAR